MAFDSFDMIDLDLMMYCPMPLFLSLSLEQPKTFCLPDLLNILGLLLYLWHMQTMMMNHMKDETSTSE